MRIQKLFALVVLCASPLVFGLGVMMAPKIALILLGLGVLGLFNLIVVIGVMLILAGVLSLAGNSAAGLVTA